jgi:hypothetical protein
VLDGEFDRTEQRLRISVSGPDGTLGTTEIDIPKDLCGPEDIEVRLDGAVIDYSLTQTATHYHIAVEYTHSTHELTADFGHIVVPGGISDIMIYLMAIAAAVITLLVAIAVTKQRKGRESIRVRELPPEKLSLLLEKKHSEEKMKKETYDDIKSLLKKYSDDREE